MTNVVVIVEVADRLAVAISSSLVEVGTVSEIVMEVIVEAGGRRDGLRGGCSEGGGSIGGFGGDR